MHNTAETSLTYARAVVFEFRINTRIFYDVTDDYFFFSFLEKYRKLKPACQTMCGNSTRSTSYLRQFLAANISSAVGNLSAHPVHRTFDNANAKRRRAVRNWSARKFEFLFWIQNLKSNIKIYNLDFGIHNSQSEISNLISKIKMKIEKLNARTHALTNFEFRLVISLILP